MQVLDPVGQARLEAYFGTIGSILRHKAKRANFAMYALGLLGGGERKSMEPIAAQVCPDEADAAHQRLVGFVSDSEWSDHDVRLAAAQHAIAAMSERSRVTKWIFDDTGFLKQGTQSVGVQRQYTGSAGKITNCQIGVSLVVANDEMHVPVDFELYLPKSWTDDPERRAKAKIPDEVTFRTKPQLALDVMYRAALARLPGEIVLADSAYGESSDFRLGIRLLGLDYAVGVHETTTVWRLDAIDRRRDEPLSVEALARTLGPGRFRRVTWREGTKAKLASRFAFVRVKVAHDDGTDPVQRESVWLVIEHPEDKNEKTKYTLTTLGKKMSKKAIVRLIKERYRTERAYQEMKGDVGLDHFEGRSYRGWHHHVSAVLACYAFLVAERVRAFPPGAEGARDDDPIDAAA